MNSRRPLSDESGISLVEVLVAILISGIVLSGLTAGMRTLLRTHRFTDQDSQAIGSLRTTLGRFARETREASRIYAGSNSKLIKMWVDYDRDNQQDAVERITWELVADGQRAQLTRVTDAGGTPRVISRDLSLTDPFSYSPSPPRTTLVRVEFTADVSPGELAGPRKVKMELRLRNATAA